MSVTVTLTYANLDEAITALAKIRVDTKEPAAAAPKPAGAKPKAEAAPAPTAEAKKADAPATPPAASSPPAAAAASVSYDVIGPKITAGAKTHRAEVVALLAKFGAKSGKELKPEDYAKFDGEIDALLKPAEEETLG